jgi:hypothetical protein
LETRFIVKSDRQEIRTNQPSELNEKKKKNPGRLKTSLADEKEREKQT